MLKDTISKIIADVTGVDTIPLMTPKHDQFGDIAINVQQIQAHKPEITAESLAEQLRHNNFFEKVDVVGNFINLFISRDELLKYLTHDTDHAESSSSIKKHIVVEFAHPNTHKMFHIGHLRNITLGESLCRLFESQNHEITRVNYQGDVGLHIAKCLYILQKNNIDLKSDTIKNMPLDDKIAYLGKAYAEGNTAYESDDQAKEHIHTINRQIYEHDPAVEPLWKETRQWSLDYFDSIYQRVDTSFKRLFFESEVADRGLEIAHKAVSDGILTKDDGAIILDGTQHGVDTRVFVNKLGLPTYEGKELGLAELEFTEFGHVDQCIHVVGPEQKSFFQTTFKAEALIDPEKFENKQLHFAYGFVDLKDGKMSSRKGNVMPGVGLLNDTRKKIQEEYNVPEETAEVLAVGAVKYSFLKVEARKNISFDVQESISLQGNSGPYLQYVYSRIFSMVGTLESVSGKSISNENAQLLTSEDMMVLRKLNLFDEAITESANSMSPHILCTYLYQLAQTFNTLYEKRSILKEENVELRNARICIAQHVARIMKNGLNLLGIRVLEKI